MSLDSKNRHYSLKILTSDVNHPHALCLYLIRKSQKLSAEKIVAYYSKLSHADKCVVFLVSRVKISYTAALKILAIAAWKRLLSCDDYKTVRHKNKFVPFRFMHNVHSSTPQACSLHDLYTYSNSK